MNSSTTLLRQVHPSFVQADTISSQVFTITSQVFRPTPKDEGLLSVYNGEKFTPEASHTHFISQASNQSFGVVGVTGEECDAQQLKWGEDNNPFDGHSYVNFNGLSNKALDTKAKLLKKIAMERGWLYKK